MSRILRLVLIDFLYFGHYWTATYFLTTQPTLPLAASILYHSSLSASIGPSRILTLSPSLSLSRISLEILGCARNRSTSPPRPLIVPVFPFKAEAVAVGVAAGVVETCTLGVPAEL